MVVDALRAYVQLASGLTEVTLDRAKTAAKALVAQAGSLSEAPAESAAQVRAMADELMKTARDNRDLVVGMVRTEVERAVGAMGVVAVEDFTALQRRLADLEARFRGGSQGDSASTAPTPDATEADATEADATSVDAPSVETPPGDTPPAATPPADTIGPDDAADAEPELSGGDRASAEPEHPAEPDSTAEPALSPSADPDAGADAPVADLDIPTPIAVERLVAKKRAAEREGDEDELDQSSAGSDQSDEAAQDPSPPDVSTA